MIKLHLGLNKVITELHSLKKRVSTKVFDK